MVLAHTSQMLYNIQIQIAIPLLGRKCALGIRAASDPILLPTYILRAEGIDELKIDLSRNKTICVKSLHRYRMALGIGRPARLFHLYCASQSVPNLGHVAFVGLASMGPLLLSVLWCVCVCLCICV